MLDEIKNSRFNSQLTPSKALSEDVYEFLVRSLFITQIAQVLSYEREKRIAKCQIHHPLFQGMEVEAPLIQDYLDLNLQKDQKVLLVQKVTDPQVESAQNYFDRGNWYVLSAFNLQEVNITLSVKEASLKVHTLKLDLAEGGEIVLGGSKGIKITSSGVSIEGKAFSSHSHSKGSLASVPGTQGGPLAEGTTTGGVV